MAAVKEQDEQNHPSSLYWLLIPFFAVLLIWVVYYLELQWGINLNRHGVYPRSLKGLQGVLFSPLIHGSLDHLYNNSLPLFILLAALIYFFPSQAFRVVLVGGLMAGLLTWLIGRPSYHIGASGLIYVLASFIFFKGIRSGHYRWVALSLGVVFVYGSMLWYILPVEKGISWEGHLSGFISGLLLSLLLPRGIPKAPKYAWEAEDYKEEEDAFMRHFDAEGNFIEQPEPDQTDVDE